MPAVDAEVVLITKSRDRETNARCAVHARLGLGGFDRVACIAVLLAQLGWFLRPLCRDATGFDLAFLVLGVALLWRRDDRGIDDLTAHRQKPGRRERCIEAFDQNRDRRVALNLGAGQRLADPLVPDKTEAAIRPQTPTVFR